MIIFWCYILLLFFWIICNTLDEIIHLNLIILYQYIF